jgi:hypothetical protein
MHADLDTTRGPMLADAIGQGQGFLDSAPAFEPWYDAFDSRNQIGGKLAAHED